MSRTSRLSCAVAVLVLIMSAVAVLVLIMSVPVWSAELPEGFQRAEFLMEKGFVDMIVHRHQLRSEIARLIDYCKP